MPRAAIAALTSAIGGLAALAQPAPAQGADVAVALALGEREAERVRERFDELLLDHRKEPEPGWRLAGRLGAPAGPVLWGMLREASALRDRLHLLGAYAQAMGPAGDAQLVEFATRMRNPRDRAFALLMIALGDPREGPPPAGLRWNGSDPEVVRVAALLARARFAGGGPVAPPAGWTDDPGLLAAGLFAGAPPPANLERSGPWRAAPSVAELVWRGYLLAPRPHDAGSERRLQRGRELYARRSDPLLPVRATAARCLSLAPQRDLVRDFLEQQEVEVELGLVLGLDAMTRRALVTTERRRRWFLPTPDPLLHDAERGRSAVIFVLHETLARLDAVSPQWNALRGGDPRVTRAVALGLAWRFLADGRRDAEWARAPGSLDGVPEQAWIAWALGAEPAVDEFLDFDDPQLTSLYQLAREDRLAASAARDQIEESLWRSGAHPQLTLREMERELVRDLLLRGGRLFDGDYLPRGIDRSDANFFPIGDDYYQFTQTPTQPPPSRWRLAGILDQG